MDKKKRPQKLEIQIGLLPIPPETNSAIAIEIGQPRSKLNKKASKQNGTPERSQPPLSGFDFRARFERKGRGGQPVFVLYAFLHENLRMKGNHDVKSLERLLKEKLSCGGSVHEGPQEEIILQFRDRERLETTLEKMGLKMQVSGG